MEASEFPFKPTGLAAGKDGDELFFEATVVFDKPTPMGNWPARVIVRASVPAASSRTLAQLESDAALVVAALLQTAGAIPAEHLVKGFRAFRLVPTEPVPSPAHPSANR